MITIRALLSTACISTSAILGFAQSDSIIFKGGNVMVGEIKEMNKGVLSVKTTYSESDFKIDWEAILALHSDQYFSIALTDRRQLPLVKLHNLAPDSLQVIGTLDSMSVGINQVVSLRQVKTTFWDRLSAAIDVGFSVTKANNLKQLNIRGNVGYKTENWILNTTYSQVRSTQNNVQPTRRVDASLGGNYQFRNGLFLGGSANWLSNTEQLIDLRTTGQLGGGYFFVRNLDWYINGFMGVAINNESFREDPETLMTNPDRESYEGVFGSEVSLYDIGDLNFFTTMYWYPSFTEAGRNRIDFRLDISYDLPYDFYIKSGVTLNYDSRPAAGASESDYVIITGLGWSL